MVTEHVCRCKKEAFNDSYLVDRFENKMMNAIEE